jgi:RNA polymerase sigma factor (TIGR02999 family)
MTDVTRILSAIELGDPHAAEQLLPLVYRKLRELAAQKLAQEKPGQTLQATDLVHEAYLRLVASPGPANPRRESVESQKHWDGRGHFFAAAAEAMRRILVENARRKKRLRHGGGRRQVGLEDRHLAIQSPVEDMLSLDEALEQLSATDQQAAELVKLRYFAGLTTEEAGKLLGLPERTAYRIWSFARAWLFQRLEQGSSASS